MAHFAVVAPPLPGHLNPLTVLADALVARGHRVTFVHQPDVERLVGGHDFAPVGSATHPAGQLDAALDRMARLGVLAGIGNMIADVAGWTDMLCRELPGALRELRIDAVVADQMEAAGGLVARFLNLPLVTTATGLPINRELGVPPPYVPWRHGTSLVRRRLSVGGWRVTNLLMRPVSRVLQHHADAFGLPGIRRTEDCFGAVQLAQCVRGLDFPRAELPEGFHYLGPWRRGEEWFDAECDGRPLAFCSLGTIQGSRAGLFRAVSQACADLGLRAVIAHGGRLADEDARSLPGSPIVRAWVPQRAVLTRSVIAVTHAGFNTVLDALSAGLPMVVTPLAFEQPATAARLKRAGVAEVIHAGVTAHRIRSAMERALNQPEYRNRAGLLAQEIAASGGVERAADLVEAAVGATRPFRTAAATVA